jgi:small subunit ribosomal protein S16
MGSKGAHTYRVVVADSRCPRDGKCVDSIGTYNSHLKTENFKIDVDAALAWLKKGAQPTKRVLKLLKKTNIISAI